MGYKQYYRNGVMKGVSIYYHHYSLEQRRGRVFHVSVGRGTRRNADGWNSGWCGEGGDFSRVGIVRLKEVRGCFKPARVQNNTPRVFVGVLSWNLQGGKFHYGYDEQNVFSSTSIGGGGERV